ncbi:MULTISPECIES: prohibitin family protein [Thiorhodovibrio]|uniref:prohibitin family protein n=1 Tax=Thiorhodovibrio TaxID=61593 RepID=UPI0019114118|nr:MULTISPECIES: prohibitin family protein [Thiorhodovibrio]
MTETEAPINARVGKADREARKRSRRSFSKRAFLDHVPPVIAMALLAAILVVMYLWHGIVAMIRPGEAGVLYRPFDGGTVTDQVYPEGLHLLWPWNRMFVYNTRVQTVLHQFDVLTNKGLTITLTLAIRYHPEFEMVGLLHQRVGPDYVKTIVVPQVESVLRRNIGKHDPEDIYTNKEGILTDIIVKAIEEAGQKFVYIDDIIIRTVSLPDEIRKAIKAKLVEQQHWYAYEYILAAANQEAERKRIEAQGIHDYQATIAETLTQEMILWEGIGATRELAQSNNSKIVIIGAGDGGLPVILGADMFAPDKTAPVDNVPTTEASALEVSSDAGIARETSAAGMSSSADEAAPGANAGLSPPSLKPSSPASANASGPPAP